MQADQHDHHRRCSFEIKLAVLSAQQLHQFIANDFDELLLRRQTLQDFLAEGLGFDRVEKSFDDFDMNIGFEQRQTHFTERVVNVFFTDFALTSKFLKGQFKFVS